MGDLAFCTDVDPPAPAPEQALWLGVLQQAVTECFHPRCAYNKLKAERLRRLAHTWVFHSPDFLKVCEFANVDPDFVRSLVTRVIPARKGSHTRTV